jgi:cytochrome c-type biogenesis protein
VSLLPDLLTMSSTFAAGLLSFAAPCTLPLVPAYLSYVAGLTGVDVSDPARRNSYKGRVVAGTALFVLGFSLTFIALGIAAGGIGHSVHAASTLVQVIGGMLIFGLGLMIAGVFPMPMAGGPIRQLVADRLRHLGIGAALPFGIVFGIGWTPCVGPLLGTALALAAVKAHALDGAILLAAYALGLGIPFIGAALAWASFPTLARKLSRFGQASNRIAGIVMAALGISVATGLYSHLTSFLAQFVV